MDEPAAGLELVTESPNPATRVIVLHGLDDSNVGLFRSCIVEAAREGKRAVLVDLSQLAYVDSRTIDPLVLGLRRFESSGRAVACLHPRPQLLATLGVGGLTEAFEVFSSRERALERLWAASPAYTDN